jgi:D-lactate dehydrogenase (cytochrome)
VAEHGGVVIVSSRMSRLLELDVQGRTALVEAGIANLELDNLVRREGLYYPPDPSSQRSSCIGGNLGTNAGGPHCFKYGVTTNYVLGLEVVLADGQVVQVGGQAFDYPEYDLAGLLVGSEGTLGVISRAYLRLVRNPPSVKTMMVSFESLAQAGEAVSAIIAAGLTPATLEAMDQLGMRLIEEYAHAGLPVEAGAALIVELDGYAEGLEAQMAEVSEILRQHDGYDLRLAQTEAERQQIWYGRKSVAGAISRISPSYYLADVTVRRSLLAGVLEQIHRIYGKYNLATVSIFHAGDGNLHPLILCDVRDPARMKGVHQAIKEVIELCVAQDGSITGEHGVGMEKRDFMPVMYSGAELAAMQEIKEIFDPEGLLNPGKVLPATLPAPQLAEAPLPEAPIFTPATAEEAAGALRALSEAGRRVRIGSAPTGTVDSADLWLSTARLQGIKTFAPADLYVTVGAGMPLAEIQAFLQPHGMQVPMVSPWPEATVGSLISANINAPLRLRYGSLRDVMLCATVAMADGRVIRAGRPLVKNVAGYDLPKIFVGAFGTLGLLVDVTLKLTPLPRSRRSLAVLVNDLSTGLDLARQNLPEALAASAIVLAPGGSKASHLLLYTAEGMPQDVTAELERVQAILQAAGAKSIVETEEDGNATWASFLGRAGEEALLVRLGVPVKALANLLLKLPSLEPDNLLLDYASGLLYLSHKPETVEAAHQWLEALRQPALAHGGYTVTLTIPPAFRAALDPWGYQPQALAVMQRLKERWDPAHILNPGRFIVG